MEHQDWTPLVINRTSNSTPAKPPAGRGGGKPRARANAESDDPLPPKKFDGEFTKQVVAARTIKGWSRADLAQQLGVSRSVVDDLENRKLVYSPQLMSKLKRVLGDFFRA